jgi:tetratricopeptide (TPR) repeat protein
MHIDHWNISRYFLGWNSDIYRFRLPHALKYCFPSNYHKFPAAYPRKSIQSQWRTVNEIECGICDDILELNHTIGSEDDDNIELLKVKIIDKEIAVYEKIDRFLLENYRRMKQSFAKARKKHLSSSKTVDIVSILLNLLLFAPTKRCSVGAENLLWQLWMSHENPLVNSCMRLGYSALKGGNSNLAAEYFEYVINYADPLYSEAYNKLAAAKFAAKDFENSSSSAAKALKHFPNHFGAFAGLGLSLEQLHKRDADAKILNDIGCTDARKAYKSVLACHPWANSISTVLQSEKNTKPKVS